MGTSSLRRPSRLRPGDRVAVVAPAGPVAREQLDAGVQILRSWGLEVTAGEHVLDRHQSLDYLAGADADRAADLQRAWLDPGTAAVFCARGGSGSLRIVDHLGWDALAAAPPKVFVGSSDLTAVHAALVARLGVVTLFGPMVATDAFVADPPAREHLRRTLFEPDSALALSGGTLVGGRARGRLVGGNLSLLAASVGTHPTPPAGAIVLLEDVGEEPYRIDRYLTQLLRAGWFDRVGGIALGSWTECGDPEAVRAVVLDRLAPLRVPLVWDLGFGHCPAAVTVPLGVTAELDADPATLTLTAPALR